MTKCIKCGRDLFTGDDFHLGVCNFCKQEFVSKRKEEIQKPPTIYGWVCPNCGNDDFKEMHVLRRTCGYLGSQGWNKGRTKEINDRVLHL